MKFSFNKSTAKTLGGLGVVLAIVVSFQNCGKAGFDAQLDSASPPPATSNAALIEKYGSVIAQKVTGIPFAFDAAFDTITYNSCADPQLAAATNFFSLKAGAYTTTGGISLSDQFYAYADSNFTPTYPETILSTEQYKTYLMDSPANNGAVPTLAVRVKNSLTDVWAVDSGNSANSLLLGKDVVPMVSELTDPFVTEAFEVKELKANYFRFSTEKKILEAQINFNDSEELADKFRDLFSSSSVLALTYMADKTDIGAIRSPDSVTAGSPMKKAYGKGYALTFAPFAVLGAATSNPSHILNSIRESDLTTPGVASKAWNCGRVYSVVRKADAASCPAVSYEDFKANRGEFEILRRHLPASEWDINPSKHCVVPKNTACYSDEQAGVEYDLTKECFSPTTQNYLGPVPTKKCLNFITVCTRD